MTRFDTVVPTESQEQQALFRYCSVEMRRYPELEMLVHIPNEGNRSVTNGARLKREGLRKGYPDILLDVCRDRYNGLRIELKRRKGSKKTKEQKEWVIRLNRYGFATAFCYGWEEAWEFLHAYLRLNENQKSCKVIDYYVSRSVREAEE